MKKILIALTIILSCLGIKSVSAASYTYTHLNAVENYCDFYYTNYYNITDLGYSDEIQELYNLVIEEYNKNYSSIYPYYFLDVVVKDKNNCNYSSEATGTIGVIHVFLNLFIEIPTYPGYTDSDFVLTTSYYVSSKTYSSVTETAYSYPKILSYDSDLYFYNPMAYFISNFDLVNSSDNTYIISGQSNFTINPGDVIKPYYTEDNVFQDPYIEINLNDYAYVALALKDYSKYNYSTTIEVKGQYCPTSVYGMGLRTSEDLLKKQVSDVCTPYYKDYTPVRINFYESIVKNFPVYYVKAYDITRDNYIKVDTNVFDITYISEEEKDNPYVLVQGNIYPTIPFDKLPSNAIQNTQNGYIPGQSDNAITSFEDIFSSPLEALSDVWDSIVTFFDLIIEFFILIPEPMRSFLYFSFALAIIIGLIKIIL